MQSNIRPPGFLALQFQSSDLFICEHSKTLTDPSPVCLFCSISFFPFMFILALESTTVGTLTWFAGLSPARMPAVTSQQCVSKYIESHSETQPSNFISRSRKSLRFLPWKRAFFITKLHCCQCCVILLFFQCRCFYRPLIIIKIQKIFFYKVTFMIWMSQF